MHWSRRAIIALTAALVWHGFAALFLVKPYFWSMKHIAGLCSLSLAHEGLFIYAHYRFFMSVVAIAVYIGLGWVYPVHIDAKPCCPNCGYDLTGNISGICPECGTEIHARPQDLIVRPR